MSRLKDRFRVTSVDFYGFGDSDLPDFPLYVDDYADAVMEIVKHYKMTDCIIVGHSFGGRVAIKLASKYGRYFSGVIITDGAGVLPRRGLKYYYRVLVHKACKALNIPHEGGSADYKKLTLLEKKTFNNIVREDLSGHLASITMPTLLVWGSNDKETPMYMAKKMLKKISSARLVILMRCGHYSYLDMPNEYYHLVYEFCQEVLYGVAESSVRNGVHGGRVAKVYGYMPK